jgi:hypothetical protein
MRRCSINKSDKCLEKKEKKNNMIPKNNVRCFIKKKMQNTEKTKVIK